MPTTISDEKWMNLALDEAKKAGELGEVPIGAVIVQEGKILAAAHNLKESTSNPCGHAEILAIQSAAAVKKSWRLEGASIYVSLEPCLMCAGAIIQARLAEVIFACRDPKGGAVISCSSVFENEGLNHRPTWREGVLMKEASSLLTSFFRQLRKTKP